MSLVIDLQQLRGVDVRVPLRRAQAGVAEEILDRPEVGAPLHPGAERAYREKGWMK